MQQRRFTLRCINDEELGNILNTSGETGTRHN